MHFEKRIPEFLKLGFNENALTQLRSYLELLWASNRNLNLVSRKMTIEELIDNHVIDCLLPLSYFPQQCNSVADFGSGGGLPAVIYAIQFPEINFHLFEKSKLKQEFLTECQKLAPNLKIGAEIPLELKNIQIITARAFKPIDVILGMSRNYFISGGKYFLLKGRREKIDGELVLARRKFPSLRVKIETLKSPVLEVERHLVLIGS